MVTVFRCVHESPSGVAPRHTQGVCEDAEMSEPAPYSRDETRGERLDRNFGEQLQEVRIAQAGVQILFAFS